MVSHVYSGTQKSAEYEGDINLSPTESSLFSPVLGVSRYFFNLTLRIWARLNLLSGSSLIFWWEYQFLALIPDWI